MILPKVSAGPVFCSNGGELLATATGTHFFAGANPNSLPFFFMADSNAARAVSHADSISGMWQPPCPLQSFIPGFAPHPPWPLQSLWPPQTASAMLARSPQSCTGIFFIASKSLAGIQAAAYVRFIQNQCFGSCISTTAPGAIVLAAAGVDDFAVSPLLQPAAVPANTPLSPRWSVDEIPDDPFPTES